MKIAIEKIIVSKDNPRQSFDEEGLRRLGESIREHGQLQSIIVRPRGSQYELVVGERRLRACALVGINEIEAEVREIDDVTAMELRLIENTQREDLSDAEKGDAVLALWANYDKYETIKDVAKVISSAYDSVKQWIAKSNKLSEKIKAGVRAHTLEDFHARYLLKYPKSTQGKLADYIISKGLSGRQTLEFTKLYDANPERNLDEIADEVLNIETVTIPKTELTDKQKRLLEEKRQFAKVHRPRKKPSKPLTKKDVQKKLKKTDYKFVPAKVSRGTDSKNVKPLPSEVEPNVVGTTKLSPPVDWSQCKCSSCPLFAKNCKGRLPNNEITAN